MPGSKIEYEVEKKISDKQTLTPYIQQVFSTLNCITYKAQLDTYCSKHYACNSDNILKIFKKTPGTENHKDK